MTVRFTKDCLCSLAWNGEPAFGAEREKGWPGCDDSNAFILHATADKARSLPDRDHKSWAGDAVPTAYTIPDDKHTIIHRAQHFLSPRSSPTSLLSPLWLPLLRPPSSPWAPPFPAFLPPNSLGIFPNTSFFAFISFLFLFLVSCLFSLPSLSHSLVLHSFLLISSSPHMTFSLEISFVSLLSFFLYPLLISLAVSLLSFSGFLFVLLPLCSTFSPLLSFLFPPLPLTPSSLFPSPTPLRLPQPFWLTESPKKNVTSI